MPSNVLQGGIEYGPDDEINALLGPEQKAPVNIRELMQGFHQNYENVGPKMPGQLVGNYTPGARAAWQQMQDLPVPGYSSVPYQTREVINRAVPSNYRAIASTALGLDEPIESSWFTPEELDYMGKQAYFQKHLQDVQQNPRTAPQAQYTYEPIGPMNEGTISHIYQSYSNPAVSTEPFTSGAIYANVNQGLQLKNYYRQGGHEREVNVLIPEYRGPFPTSYNRPWSQ